MNMLSITVSEQDENRRVADVLRGAFCVSETYLRRLKRRPGALLINGMPVYTVAQVHAGDIVTFDPSDGETLPISPIPYPLQIVYEDEWLIVLDKPGNFSVHPARDPMEPTVENALRAILPAGDNPHPVSRLDKGTTGLLTVAKSGYIHARMKSIQHAGAFQKTYLALAEGVPTPAVQIIDAPIGPRPGSTYAHTVRADGAEARSLCEVLETFGDLSLLRLTPYTGRTHQLRVHMAHIGHTLLGDWLYGHRSPLIGRPALHAAELTFPHPITGETVSLAAPLPADMQAVIDEKTPRG